MVTGYGLQVLVVTIPLRCCGNLGLGICTLHWADPHLFGCIARGAGKIQKKKKGKGGEKSELLSSLILCCTAQVLNQMQLTAARKEWGFGQQKGSSPLWLDVVAIEMSAWLSHSTATKALANRKKNIVTARKTSQNFDSESYLISKTERHPAWNTW